MEFHQIEMIVHKPSTHAVISNRRGTNCGHTNFWTYIENCHIDTISSMFNLFYDNMVEPNEDGVLSSSLKTFTQVNLYFYFWGIRKNDWNYLILGKYLRIKGQVLKIRACNTATSAVLHASIFNTWPLILKYLYYLIFLFIPKNKVFSNTDPSSSIRNVHVFSNTVNVKYWVLKNKIGFFFKYAGKIAS